MILMSQGGKITAGPEEFQELPDDHDCEKCGCVFPDSGWHHTESGLCLGCGGCGDPQCCGGHDDWCRFKPRTETQ